jgi:hypothetical protein
MKIYKPREIKLNQLLTINSWKIKVYTITNRTQFESAITLQSAVAKLPEWLEKSQLIGFGTYETAFLIVHEGIDGVWTLINWWTDGEILQGMTFYTNFDCPTEFQKLPKEGFMACVWEMEVILFERGMWIEHILKKAKKPDFETYFHKSLNNDNGLLDQKHQNTETPIKLRS